MGKSLYVITGVANEASIAWGVAEHLFQRGDQCVLASLPKNLHRARGLLAKAGFDAEVFPLDVSNEQSIDQFVDIMTSREVSVAGLLHSIAFANMEDLTGPTFESSRSGFLESMNISVYSLIALARGLAPCLRRGSSIVALSYHGAQKCLPGYNMMGVVKAALESACRYLAYDLGPRGIRVNCASPGPLLTLSSSPFPEIQEQIECAARASPLRGPILMQDVAETVGFLLSDRAGGMTGQIVYSDNGLSILGAGLPSR